MDVSIQNSILAIVTCTPEKITGGGCPVFLAEDQAEMEKIGLYIARVLGGIVHDLENGVYFIVKH